MCHHVVLITCPQFFLFSDLGESWCLWVRLFPSSISWKDLTEFCSAESLIPSGLHAGELLAACRMGISIWRKIEFWLKAAKQAEFTIVHAEMAWQLQGPGCMAAPGARMALAATSHPTKEKKRNYACFFFLKYDVTEALLTMLIGLTACLFSEPACNWFC